jgi:hypothetical protein
MQVELWKDNFNALNSYIEKSKKVAPGYDVSITALANFLLKEKLAVELKRLERKKS